MRNAARMAGVMLVVAWVAAMSGCGKKDAPSGMPTPGGVASELKGVEDAPKVDAADPNAPGAPPPRRGAARP
mgnify:CR=1 FL=1